MRQIRTTHASLVFESQHDNGPRVIKVLRNRTDAAGLQRYERERSVLRILDGRIPYGVIPRVVAADAGVLVTEKLEGKRVHDMLWRPGRERFLAVRRAGQAAGLLAAAELEGIKLPSTAPPSLDGALSAVTGVLPDWLGDQAAAAVAQAEQSAFVHGDFVPTNWLWDGNRIAVLDFEWARLGSPQEDVATAWARLRLAGFERGFVSNRLASEVIRHWNRIPAVQWRAYALVKTVAIILWRMRSRPRPLQSLELRLLRRSLDDVLKELAE